MRRIWLFGLVLLCFGNAACAFATPDALWNIVHGQCMPNAIAGQTPAPCSALSLQSGYAVLKDLRGNYQYLLIPTRRITGIEEPFLETPEAPNYFADAWRERGWLEKKLGGSVARQDVALAVNSYYGRSQNQLHIHIDCIRPDVAAALAHARFGGDWTQLVLPPSNHVYLARQINAAELSGINPFALIAAQRPKENMALETAVITGAELADGKPGFILLSSRAELSKHDAGSGEELLDPSCAIVKPH